MAGVRMKRGDRDRLEMHDADKVYVQTRALAYLCRISRDDSRMKNEAVELLQWIAGNDLQGIFETTFSLLSPARRRAMEAHRYWEDGAERDEDFYQWTIAKAYGQMGRERRQRVWRAIDRECSFLEDLAGLAEESVIARNFQEFGAAFGLCEIEVEVLRFLFMAEHWEDFGKFFVNELESTKLSQRGLLARILGVSRADLDRAFSGRLNALKLVTGGYRLEVAEEVQEAVLLHDGKSLSERYFRTVRAASVPLSQFQVPLATVEHMTSLLRAPGERPVHILLYGAPGTGKTSFARALVEAAGMTALEAVQPRGDESGSKRLAIHTACVWAQGNPEHVVVADDADGVLNTAGGFFLQGEVRDKGWLNQLMEEPGLRVVWIVNRVEEVDEAVRRRFAFSLCFGRLSRAQRVRQWAGVLAAHGAEALLGDGEVESLVRRFDVSTGVVDMAVAQSLRVAGGGANGGDDGREAFRSALTRSLAAHMVLRENGRRLAPPQGSGEGYSLEGLSIAGDLAGTMRSLKAFDGWLRADGSGRRRNCNLLFYGPPGTGKSALARHVAESLDRELLEKRLSDILDPYVGMTERNIAAAFAEAEDTGAVLVFDEADSLLFSRGRARRSWEVNQVNEFLTSMERFRGILICTTNAFDDLDAASLRRFGYKIGFRTLAPEGSLSFYGRLLASLAATPLPPSGEARLRRMEGLTPGDFKVVRDRFDLLVETDGEACCHDALLDALEEELAARRRTGAGRILGF
ncbi:AAA ATPase central domain protein [Desulfovibrio sp. X2]|uniref:ATP-binding protein n=1 Tax=Desulfovibrio sp. X2 TaxID=941449 RepID=UPI000358B83F|nr:ATP-binding protein [Desulfovibrio sp. X2]EPR37706.1 AAA ATPase central domain protein [Desulfovibrio sp. X2]